MAGLQTGALLSDQADVRARSSETYQAKAAKARVPILLILDYYILIIDVDFTNSKTRNDLGPGLRQMMHYPGAGLGEFMVRGTDQRKWEGAKRLPWEDSWRWPQIQRDFLLRSPSQATGFEGCDDCFCLTCASFFKTFSTFTSFAMAMQVPTVPTVADWTMVKLWGPVRPGVLSINCLIWKGCTP